MIEDKSALVDMVVDIVTAYITKNVVPAAELSTLISTVHKSLSILSFGCEARTEEVKAPAVPIKKSIGSDYLIRLEDGRKFKSLKSHLRTRYNMSPDDYRAKWNLPKDYPMVAPAYVAARSHLAKQMGLGQGGRKSAARDAGASHACLSKAH